MPSSWYRHFFPTRALPGCAAIDVEDFIPRLRLRPRLVTGRVSVSGRSVRLRKRTVYRNPLQAHLVGRLEEHKGGAVFLGKARVGLPCFDFFVTACGSGLVLLCQAALSVLAIREVLVYNLGWTLSQGNLPLALVPLFPLLTLALIVRHVRFWRWLARDEERLLVAFVADVIGAPPPPEALRWKPAKPRRVAPNPGGGPRVEFPEHRPACLR